jgi:peroxiredoxin family protein
MNKLVENTLIQPVTSEFLLQHKPALDAWFEEKYAQKKREEAENHVASLSIIATKGTMDMGYPPFILASTAAALGWDVSIFFTFYGLELLKRDLNLKISPLGNPSMPMKMPFGPNWFRQVNWNIPNALMSNIPGFESMATALMNKTISNNGVASIEELRSLSLEAGVKMVACQMTVELFGYTHEDFIPEVSDWIGAASFLPEAQTSDVCLFI